MSRLICNEQECTGCGACYNICPHKAITMSPDENGFLHPVIDEEKCVDCGLCEKACPVLNATYLNQQPECYAAMGDDEIRQVSSSGGIFSLLAETVLEQDGIVFGAAWTKEWSVAHTSVSSSEELQKLRGSKYLQSDTNTTYGQAAEVLKNGTKVLYSGCPCQIAGLLQYLRVRKIPIENLLTVEIICHGAPSYKMFRTYLNENFDVDTIENINFRDKSYGWGTATDITFADGTKFHESDRIDAYWRAFLPCMSMRNSCKTCPFSRLPRQADISLGDYWGVERFDKTLNDRKGTSIVLTNSNRGRKAFDQIKSKLKRYESTPLEYATHINKTILHPFSQHPGRNHLYRSLGGTKVNHLVTNALEDKYDVGIVGLWYGLNYGSVLTYYALYQLICELGFDPVFIPRPKRLWVDSFDDPNSLGQAFIRKYCSVLPNYQFNHEHIAANDRCTDFVVGSDVVWNYKICGKDADMFFFLDWVEKGHKKIAYASSWGIKNEADEDYLKKAKYYLSQFDAISQREKSGLETLENYGIEHGVVTLDPVFLVDTEVYNRVAQNVENAPNAPFVFAYLLRYSNPDGRKNWIQEAKEHFQADSVICVNPMTTGIMVEKYGDIFADAMSIEQWLYHIKNCELVIADSFHALCFSILYHKKFIIVYETNAWVESDPRFKNLLSIVGLEDRIIEKEDDYEHFTRLLDTEIDWESVDHKLSSMKAFSRNWLLETLQGNISNRTDSYESRMICDAQREMLRMENEIFRLQEENRLLNERQTGIVGRIDSITRRGIHALRTRGIRYTLERFYVKVKWRIERKRNA